MLWLNLRYRLIHAIPSLSKNGTMGRHLYLDGESLEAVKHFAVAKSGMNDLNYTTLIGLFEPVAGLRGSTFGCRLY